MKLTVCYVFINTLKFAGFLELEIFLPTLPYCSWGYDRWGLDRWGFDLRGFNRTPSTPTPCMASSAFADRGGGEGRGRVSRPIWARHNGC